MSKKLAVILVSAMFLAAGLIWANAPVTPLPVEAKVDRIVVTKAARNLTLYSKGAVIGSYSVALGREAVGAKLRQGDRRTPEGLYFIDSHNSASSFHRALHVSYPSPADTARARTAGSSPGGEVMIHGMRNGLGWLGRAHLLVDWTSGCVAVTNAEMDQIFKAVPDGTPIEIRP